MPRTTSGPSRRSLLLAAALVPLAGCGTGTESPARRATPAPAPSRLRPAPSVDVSEYAALERRHGARLGVYALDTGSGAAAAYRDGERFAFCSTFKALAAAAVLHREALPALERRVPISADDVNTISPVTETRTGGSMTVRQLCDAAVRFSDGTAGNLLLRELGGPDGLTAYFRTLGDTVSRMDRYEPGLHRGRVEDPRDTTTPRAVSEDFRRLLLGDALPADKRALLDGWMRASTTGESRIRAALPKGWRAANKTGTGKYGRANDVAVLWPPSGAPLLLAVMSDRPGADDRPQEALVAEAARLALADVR
ncbi:class A beta-lactamase [Streptomyces sp. NPDC001941]|uniref:class A beta-lactamase n=1 Tax=Streptomyces sp. NPDC001941 TaxID=3154659 RepID=UPI00331D6D55